LNLIVLSYFTKNFLIEEGYIEYGDFENCNIDTELTSKILRLVISKKSYGNIKFIFELDNIDCKMGSNGVIASPIIISSHPHPPFDPVLLSMLSNSKINSILPFLKSNSCRYYSFDDNFFEVYVPVVDIKRFSQLF